VFPVGQTASGMANEASLAEGAERNTRMPHDSWRNIAITLIDGVLSVMACGC
jgi:hypothetical protein